MHMCLGRSWVHCRDVPAGQHKLTVVAGPNTITDQNDRVSLTVWQLGDGVAVRTSTDTTCPAGNGQVLATDEFAFEGGALLVSASASGWVTQASSVVAIPLFLAKDNVGSCQVYANNANQHLAAVPCDFVNPATDQHGHTALTLQALPSTSTDGGDLAHLTAIEWVNPPDAPVPLETSPYLQDSSPASQQGGEYVTQASFQSGGGTLLLRVSASAWTPQSDTLLGLSIQIDGRPVGRAELFANPSATHLMVVSNDLVVTGIPAGTHTFALQSDVYTYTDQNDRVSLQVLEFPLPAGGGAQYAAGAR